MQQKGTRSRRFDLEGLCQLNDFVSHSADEDRKGWNRPFCYVICSIKPSCSSMDDATMSLYSIIGYSTKTLRVSGSGRKIVSPPAHFLLPFHWPKRWSGDSLVDFLGESEVDSSRNYCWPIGLQNSLIVAYLRLPESAVKMEGSVPIPRLNTSVASAVVLLGGFAQLGYQSPTGD